MLCWEGVVEMWGVPTAWLSMGYLFIIYGVRELSQDMEGAGGQCRCWWGTEGWHQALTSTSWLCLCPKWGWQGHSCGRWLREQARGWMGLVALGPCACPLRGHRGVRGSISAGEHPMLSPGFPSPPCAALLALAPHPGGEGGSGLPPGPSWRRTFTFTAI